MGFRLLRLPEFLDKWGCPYRLVDGWAERSRQQNHDTYTDIRAFQFHHTVSVTSPVNDVHFQIAGSPIPPVGNCLFDREGVAWIQAVGPSNTAGAGGPWPTSRGAIEKDNGNRRVFACEIANSGVGERYPTVQCDRLMTFACAVIDCINETTPGPNLDWGAHHSHHEYAPTRKVDTRGPAKLSDGTVFAEGNLELWRMDVVRGALARRWARGPSGIIVPDPTPGTPVPGTPNDKDKKMYVFLRNEGDGRGRVFLSDMTKKVWIKDPTALAAAQFTLGGAGYDVAVHDVSPAQMAAYGPLDESVPDAQREGNAQGGPLDAWGGLA